jgi:hypothetical protein
MKSLTGKGAKVISLGVDGDVDVAESDGAVVVVDGVVREVVTVEEVAKVDVVVVNVVVEHGEFAIKN